MGLDPPWGTPQETSKSPQLTPLFKDRDLRPGLVSHMGSDCWKLNGRPQIWSTARDEPATFWLRSNITYAQLLLQNMNFLLSRTTKTGEEDLEMNSSHYKQCSLQTSWPSRSGVAGWVGRHPLTGLMVQSQQGYLDTDSPTVSLRLDVFGHMGHHACAYNCAKN